MASGSSANAYLVSDGVSNLLLDAGLSWKDIQGRSGFKKIDVALISHAHKDHSKSIPELLKHGIETYAPSNCFDTQHHNAFHAIPGDGSVFDSWKVMPFELVHDVKCVGYLVEARKTKGTVVYITDTAYCKFTFSSVTHWLIECNHSRDIMDDNIASGTLNASLRNRIVKSHMNLDTVKELLLANDLSQTEEIWLLHLSNDNSDAERFRREVQEVTGKIVRIA